MIRPDLIIRSDVLDGDSETGSVRGRRQGAALAQLRSRHVGVHRRPRPATIGRMGGAASGRAFAVPPRDAAVAAGPVPTFSVIVSAWQVADLIGTKKSSISRIENSAGDIRLSTLQRYAEAVGHRLVLELKPEKPVRTRKPRKPAGLAAAD